MYIKIKTKVISLSNTIYGIIKTTLEVSFSSETTVWPFCKKTRLTFCCIYKVSNTLIGHILRIVIL